MIFRNWCLIICHATLDVLVCWNHFSQFTIRCSFHWLTCIAAGACVVAGNWTADCIPVGADIFQCLPGLLMHHHFIWAAAGTLSFKSLPVPNEEIWCTYPDINAACTEELTPDAALPSHSLPCTLNTWSTTVSFINFNKCDGILGSLQEQGKTCPVRPSLIGRLGWHSWWWTAQHAWLNSLVLVDHLTTTKPHLDIKITAIWPQWYQVKMAFYRLSSGLRKRLYEAH